MKLYKCDVCEKIQKNIKTIKFGDRVLVEDVCEECQQRIINFINRLKQHERVWE